MSLKATIPGKSGISAPSNGMLFHCHMRLRIPDSYHAKTLKIHTPLVRFALYMTIARQLMSPANTFTHNDNGIKWSLALIQMHKAMKQHQIVGS